ncbi:MAG: hypothetical protein WA047_01350 [Phenylobacterium sp.]|uniref:hypothetical protein n=1 Tax=Phenylobacterium sp. TaxID=1871053 RepID=UPI003BB54315
MSFSLASDEDVAPPLGASAAPQVLLRVITTPPGMPWEQTRAAQLEVRHGAPLPIADLMHKMMRMRRWSPGQPGRFAVFYIRAREFREPFETVVDVEGTPTKVAFGAGAEQMRRARITGLAVLLLVVSGLIIGAGAAMALNARAQASARLETAELTVANRLKAAKAIDRRRREGRLLRTAVGAARPVDEVLADLAWASASKSPAARIDVVHWDHGLLAVEVRGEEAPFEALDRIQERSSRPIRRGVWLWGVKPSLQGAGQ